MTNRIEGRLRQNEGALFPATAELLGFLIGETAVKA
jgi:hypothetical protein